MLKRVISVLLALGLLSGVHAMAVNAVDTEGAPSASAERTMPADFDPSMIPQGDFDPSKMPQGETSAPPMEAQEDAQTTDVQDESVVVPENVQVPENQDEAGQMQNGNFPFGGRRPEGMGGFGANMQNSQNTATEQPTGFLGFVKTYSTPITSVILLGLAYLFVIFYKRKHY